MFITVRKKTILIIAVLALLVVTGVAVLSAGIAAEAFAKSGKQLPVYAVDTDKKVVAITFDAAWGADKTEEILNILKEYGADATFFLVGFWIDKYEDMVKLIDKRGMLIGNHSNNHLKMSLLSEESIIKELSYVNSRIKELTEKDIKFFRAPFGDYNNLLINTVSAEGLTTIQWDVDSLDWKGLSAGEIKDRVLSRVKNGSIILFHNNSDNILGALSLILKELKGQGYGFVSLDELVYADNYYIDNNGVQHKK